MRGVIFTCSSLGNGGRLGNQLFTIFSTIGIASKFPGSQVIFPKWEYEKYFLLSSFVPGFEFGLLDPNEITHIYHEPQFHYTEFRLEDCVEWKKGTAPVKVIDLKGYFQSPKYWEHIKVDLISRFRFENLEHEVEKKFESIRKQIKFNKECTPATCSLHMRFGDYVNNPYYFNLATSTYYKEAIIHIANKRPEGQQLFIPVFSDNIMLAAEEMNKIRYELPKDIDFIFINDSFTDIESLFMMSHCDNHIIANSSFSWWGAYFNYDSDKTIIAPKNWFAGHGLRNNTKDLYTEQMKLM